MRKPAALVLLAASILPMTGSAMAESSYNEFQERRMVRAIVEADLAYLSQGGEAALLGKKLFGVELYRRVGEHCTKLTERQRFMLSRLQSTYLSQLLALPSKQYGSERAALLDAAGKAEGDADILVKTQGCDSTVVRRIVDEIGG